jgi:phenylacrylic acid decarboxylase
MTGASGAAIGAAALRLLRSLGAETHLVVSKWAATTARLECGLSVEELAALADHSHDVHDLTAPIASGSFGFDAMLIAPCSARTLGMVASGCGDSLIARAADVALKERRRLILALREAPLSLIHLRNAVAVTEAGAIVFPTTPAFYTAPKLLDEAIDQMAARLVQLCGVEGAGVIEWGTS